LVFERLKRRIEKDLNIKTCNFERTYAGYEQKNAGAWSWCCTVVGSEHLNIGSCESATDLLNKPEPLSFVDSMKIDREIC